MNRSIFFNISLILLLFLLGTSCKKTDLAIAQDHSSGVRPVGDFIRNNYDLSLLYAALNKTGLVDSLNGTGPFTVWAPDNNAFNKIGITRPEDFDSMNIDSLRYAMKYLIIPQRLYISDLPSQIDFKYTTLSGGLLYVSVQVAGSNADAYTVAVNGCQVYSAPKRNIQLQNGALHLLQSVPKYFPGKTIQDYLAADTSFSLFSLLMKKTNQWDSLGMAGAYTVYAPGNDVLRNYQLTQDSINRMDFSKYARPAFQIYTLSLQTHHIFSTDVNMAGGYFPRVTLDQGYTLSPSFEVDVWTPDGKYGYHGPTGVGYANSDKGTNNLLENGVLYRINNLLLYPDSLRIK